MKKVLGYIGVGLREVFWIAIAGGVIFGGITGFNYLGENHKTPRSAPLWMPVGFLVDEYRGSFSASLHRLRIWTGVKLNQAKCQ